MEDKNSSVFVICEYNPFHAGHAFQLRTLKSRFSRVVCLMSGDIVQRGEAAIAGKYVRAEAAVRCGADLVLELPYPFSFLSARDFARAGVSLANALNAEVLAFGAEDDEKDIRAAADALSHRSAFSIFLRTQKRLSYPRAAEAFVRQQAGDAAADAVRRPNNILAIEYCNAIRALRTPILPLFLPRDIAFASSSVIREQLNAGDRTVLDSLPAESAAVLEALSPADFPWSTENLTDILLAAMRFADADKPCYGIDRVNFRRIRDAARDSGSLPELLEKASSPALTDARIRRTLLCTLFGVSPAIVRKKPSYTLLLASSPAGRQYLSEHRKTFRVPILTKPAQYRTLPPAIRKDFLISLRASEVIALAAPCPKAAENLLKKTPFLLQ